jgi:hypothetical protein
MAMIWRPPPNFRIVESPRNVRLDSNPPSFLTAERRYHGAKGRGKAYEKRGLEYLANRYGAFFLPHPWFAYEETGSSKTLWAQPDGLLFNIPKGRVTIFELKLKHTADAWWQLRKKYEPLLHTWLEGHYHIEVCEMVQWYDGTAEFPENVLLTPEPQDLTKGTLGVFIWHPKHKKYR